ncbi:MAG: zf-HC2 domain-containing protein [Gemmatimonadota bacterium]
MSDCFVSPDRLSAYADGTLAESDRAGVESHLTGCPRCQAELAWLQTLAAQVSALPRGIDPPEALWSQIAPRLNPVLRRTDVRIRPMTLAAAAVALMVISAGLTALWFNHRGQTGPMASSGATPLVVPAVSSDQSVALASLVQQVQQLEASLPAGTRELVATQLKLIDAAIQESQAALAGHATSGSVERMLQARYQQRLELLEQARRVARAS